MSQTNWEADKMLDVYIYDYLVKRNLQSTAKTFQAEGKVSSDPVAIDAPGGFLFEWWSVFWDIFIARTNEKHSDVAASYIDTQLTKAREKQQQQQQNPSQQHQFQMQQLILQRNAQQQQQQQQTQQQQQQQQRRDGLHFNGTANGIANIDPIMHQNPAIANALATKMYEERLKLPLRESFDDTSIKRYSENSGQLLDPNQTSVLKSTATAGQPTVPVLHAISGSVPSNLSQVQARNQQLPVITQDMKSEINPVLNSRGTASDGSLVGLHGSNNGGTLKGWPLTGIDQLRLQQKPFIQSSQPFHQLQMLSPQQQQQLLFQAQQNLSSTQGSDIDGRRLRTFFTGKNMMIGKDGQSCLVGDSFPNVGSPIQTAPPALPRGESDILLKMKLAMLNQQQQQQQISSPQQQFQQQTSLNHQSQSSNQSLQQQDKMNQAIIGGATNSFRVNDQVGKNPPGRKRKQPASSSGPANSSGTANTAGPSPNSAPSTPSTHTPGDVISMQHSTNSSKPLMMFNSDGTGTLTSPNQIWDDKGEFLVEDGSLEDNVESYLSPDDTDPRDTIGGCMDITKGFTFNEVGIINASSSKVVCCHFSSDGKLLATGGHDKKAILWHTDSMKAKTTLEEHSHIITDVRFSPSMSRVATSSFDKTVRVWDADNPGYSLRTFTGHSASVMSLDFHPNKEDLICSSDSDSEIRYWSINNGSCARVFKGGIEQMRFQPRLGRYLAAAAENVVSVLDVETQSCFRTLKGHTKPVYSVCWDKSGDYLASASEDSVRVWAIGTGSEEDCVHKLSCSGNKFHSCVFHPTYPSLLAIGCYQSLELWNMAENKTMTLSAHDGLIAALAVSNVNGLIASASHDKQVKLWK